MVLKNVGRSPGSDGNPWATAIPDLPDVARPAIKRRVKMIESDLAKPLPAPIARGRFRIVDADAHIDHCH